LRHAFAITQRALTRAAQNPAHGISPRKDSFTAKFRSPILSANAHHTPVFGRVDKSGSNHAMISRNALFPDVFSKR
jgi:hypothetical protein